MTRYAAVLLALTASAATRPVSFNGERVYLAGAKPDSAAVGDFNNDGKPDLAVTLNDSAQVAILLGNGDGTFQHAVYFPVGSAPDSVTVGDFNHDGNLDLAVANASSNTLSILLGNGDGTFQPQVTYAVQAGPASIAVADFNRDGKPDLAVANAGVGGTRPNFGHTISILLGNGDGTFQPQVTYTVGEQPVSLVVRDLNGDGKPDLAVACKQAGAVSILLGKGNGTFQPAASYSAGGYPVAVAAGDFTGGGKIDLAVADTSARSSDSAITVLLGNGDGTFQSPVGYILGGTEYGTAIAVGDFNGDHKLDIVVGTVNSFNQAVPCSISLVAGNGDGTFQAPVVYPQNGEPVFMTTSDLNGDGTPDVVTANLNPDSLGILLGGHGKLGATVMDTLPGSGTSVATGDFNGDGIPDLAVNGDGVLILLGNGDGTFQPPVSYAAGDGAIVVGDFNGDGKLDLAVTDYGDGLTNPGNTVGILLGNGDGTFQPVVSYQVGLGPLAIAVGDFNGDGKLDLAVANQPPECCESTLSILLGNGDGTFQHQTVYAVPATSVAVGDFNGDGKLDLAVTNPGASGFGNVFILLGNGDGTFQPRVAYPAGASPAAVTVGDFNQDGKLDLAVADSSANTVAILLGEGNGAFQTPVSYGIGAGGDFIITGDFNADGALDLAVVDGSSDTISILAGNGDGTFQPQIAYAAGWVPESVAAADFNGDGKLDLVVANSRSSNISILTHTTH